MPLREGSGAPEAPLDRQASVLAVEVAMQPLVGPRQLAAEGGCLPRGPGPGALAPQPVHRNPYGQAPEGQQARRTTARPPGTTWAASSLLARHTAGPLTKRAPSPGEPSRSYQIGCLKGE